MKKIRPIMFVGTGSDVGKSVINSGFCRIFLQDGYHPAPFKAQNMSLNSYATKENLEIGRAQAVQAEACGIECSVDMNPILLKPTTNQSSQVVLNGKPHGNKSALSYFQDDNRAWLFEEAKKAFDRLKSKYSPVVMEGAGSISEMNLWEKDIVNMRMAQYADAATFLVADIDRGGVFASVYGSIMLLPDEQRSLIKGVIINKFRGDIRLFESGKKILKDITGVPVIGVLPYFKDIFIEQEDSVVLETMNSRASELPSGSIENPSVNIAVLRLRSLSNFTDFNILARTEGVHLFYTDEPSELEQADIVIIPGSKNTINDMFFLKEKGLDKAIVKHHKADKPLYGICGGYQIMGTMIYDPLHIEGAQETVAGLGILPMETTIENEKITRQCKFVFTPDGSIGQGYEIHAGSTVCAGGIAEGYIPLSVIESAEEGRIEDGCYISDRCWGSYIHGIFDNKAVINSVLAQVDANLKAEEDYWTMKERNYNLLAEHVRKYIDMDYVYSVLND